MLFGLFSFQAGLALAEAPTAAEKTSQRLREAIVAGLPGYDGKPLPAPVDKSTLEIDPESVVLAPFVVTEGATPKGASPDRLEADTDQLTAGTGITVIKGKKATISVGRILFIPIWFSIRW